MAEYLLNAVLKEDEKLTLEAFSNSNFLLVAEKRLLKMFLSSVTKINEDRDKDREQPEKNQ